MIKTNKQSMFKNKLKKNKGFTKNVPEINGKPIRHNIKIADTGPILI
jgi:hypothetical protein